MGWQLFDSIGAPVTAAITVTQPNLAVSAGTYSANFAAITLADSNGVSFGLETNGVITGTVRTNYVGAGFTTATTSGTVIVGTNSTNGLSLGVPAFLTTAALSQDSSKYAGINGAITGGSITVNTSGVSVNLPAYLTTAMASNRGSDFVQATAGFHGTNASGTIASDGISISVVAGVSSPIQFSAGTFSDTRTDITFGDSNGVSFGLDTNGIITATVQTDYQSSGAYLTTAMASDRGTDFVQATAVFYGTNASGTIASDGISVSVASAAAGVVQFSAGTLSATRTDITFLNSNGVSFGLETDGNITATVKTDYQTSGAYLTTAMQSDAVTISNIKVSAGTISRNLSAVTFLDSNGVSFGLNTNSVITATVKTDYQTSGAYLTTAALSSQTLAFTLSGNSATTNSSQILNGGYALAGANNITIRQSNNTVSISGPDLTQYLTTAALSQDSSKYAGTNGAITGGSITVNTSGVSVNLPAYLTTAMLSNAVTISNIKISAGTISRNLSAITFSDSNGVSWGLDTNSVITATVQTDYQSSGAYLTTAALSQDSSKYAGINGAITGGSITVNTSGVSVNLPAYITTADLSQNSSKYVQAWEITGNTSGTTSSAPGTKMYFAGGNSLTISGNGNTLTFSVGNYLTTARASTDAVGLNTALTANGVAWTVNSSGISLNVPAFLTTADLSANSSKYIQNWKLTGNTAGTTSSAQGTDLWIAGGNGITISGNSNTLTISGTTYNSVGTATTVAAVASANSVGTVSRWAAEDHAHAGIGAVGISTAGNSSGTSGSEVGTYWFQGGNSITLSQITSNNGSHTLVVSGPSLTTVSEYDPWLQAPISNSSLGQSTLYFAPFDIPGFVSASRVNFFLSITHTYSGAPQNSTAWLALGYGLYTRMTGTGSDRISLSTSYSLSYISGSVSSSTRLSMTNYAGLSNATSHTTTQYGVQNATASNFLINSYAGYRVIAMPLNVTLTPGRYWMGVSVQSASQGASFILGHSVIQHQLSNQLAYQVFNTSSSASNANEYPASAGLGIYSAQSAVWPNSIPLTSDSIRLSVVATIPYFNFSGISTSTNIL